MPAQNLPGLTLDRSHRLSDGLLSWFPMNEQSGAGLRDVVTGKVSTALNVSAGWRTGSPLGGGVLLDGTDDYAPFTVAATLTGWSMVAWIRPDAWSAISPYESTIMAAYGAPPYARVFFGHGGSAANKQHLSIDSGYATNTTTIDQTAGKWIHVVGTCDAVAQKIYVNGQLIGAGAGAAPITSVGTYYIGSLPGYGRYFSGGMAHARFYGRVLDAREVAQLYTDPLAGALAPSRAARFYVQGFKAAWASRSNQIIGGG